MEFVSEIPRKFTSVVGKSLEESVSLQEYSHFKIGGEADYLFTATSPEDLINAIHFARDSKLNYYVIGGGYNILFDDAGFRGLIIYNQVKCIEFKQESEVIIASGSTLEELVNTCRENGYGGVEFLVGIPGTVGGAVYGNAGAFDQDIGEILTSARLLTSSGELKTVQRSFFSFDYRQSRLKQTRDILLEASLEVYPRDKQQIESHTQDYLKRRETKHPPRGIACAGSYFKNPLLPSGEKVPAAFLLDKVGAKSLHVGDARVYSGHANFIINKGNARSQDVRELASRLKKRVKNKFDIKLEEEVIFLPAVPLKS